MADRIVHAGIYFENRESGRAFTPADHHALLLARDGLRAGRHGIDPASVGGPDGVDLSAPPAIARIEDGKWIADCPAPGCRGAMIIFGDPAAGFMCASCFNSDIGRRYRPVLWPAEKGAIEELLLRRPMPVNRNWSSSETAADIAAENAGHGIAVGVI